MQFQTQALPTLFASPAAVCTIEADAHMLRCSLPAAEPFPTLHAIFEQAAESAPHQVFLKEKLRGAWRTVTYRDAQHLIQAYGRALLRRGATPERPVAILSQNSINHALLALGAMSVGIPIAPISVAYSQTSSLERLENIFRLLTPAIVYAESWVGFERALMAAVNAGAEVLVAEAEHSEKPLLTLEWLEQDGQMPDSIRPRYPIGPDAIAKILFTSGSTGSPKGTLITQRMMCSNQEALAQCWPFLRIEPPVAVDWLPWSHVFGGCLIFNAVLRHRGTLVIDDGRPVGSQFERTIENLKDFPPTIHLSVPRALDELVSALKRDEELCKSFFSRLRLIFSAGAGLPKNTWEALHELKARYAQHDMRIVIGYGSTETAPVVCVSAGQSNGPDNIGTPIPGAEIKLAPNEDQFEIRVRGPMVTPGYWRRPDLAAEILDEDGYYKMGDAGKLEDPEHPDQGILFDGRVAEDFKLVTGTWVRTTNIRIACVSALAPVIQDAVVTGHDRNEIGLLAFPSLEGCRKVANLPHASIEELVDHPAVRDSVAFALAKMNQQGGSSERIGRVVFQLKPPSVEAGEITDKGYINQRAALRQREHEVARLYDPTPSNNIIFPAAS